MTRDLATSLLNRAADGRHRYSTLLNRAADGAQLLEILESIAEDANQGTVTDHEGNPIIW
jgi:hypothetical protein